MLPPPPRSTLPSPLFPHTPLFRSPIVNWKSHHYTHLLEQPTLFYAVIVFLHLSGGDVGYTRWIAWAYVVLRIVHSLWQATVNRVPVRFAIFSLYTLCLLALSVLAVIATDRKSTRLNSSH